MSFVIITLMNIIWVLYSLIEGIREASYDTSNCLFNLKKIFNFHRFLVLLSIGILLFYIIGWLSIIYAIGQIFMFKYFHMITYKATILKLENNNITDNNDTIIEEKMATIFNFLDRKKKIMLLVGIFLQVFTYLFLI